MVWPTLGTSLVYVLLRGLFAFAAVFGFYFLPLFSTSLCSLFGSFEAEVMRAYRLMCFVHACLSEQGDKDELTEIMQKLTKLYSQVTLMWEKCECTLDDAISRQKVKAEIDLVLKEAESIWERYDNLVAKVITRRSLIPQTMPFLDNHGAVIPFVDNVWLSLCTEDEQWNYLVVEAKRHFKSLSGGAANYAANYAARYGLDDDDESTKRPSVCFRVISEYFFDSERLEWKAGFHFYNGRPFWRLDE